MISDPYPVLVRAMSESGPPTVEDVERIASRIDRELGVGPNRNAKGRADGMRSTSIALAAAIVGIDKRDPAFRSLRARLTGALHITA